MIEVFKTNVQKAAQSRLMIKMLKVHFPASHINFDLEDCDKVLRIESKEICAQRIIQLLNLNGHYCAILD
ncbi:hypothetical protein FPZ42_05195 [Mucilaginibacter achroorhodeus]|uniref:Uncharacterized protein n=1 Tax=Mucilaginibacter achroorhodeus TaxID=2599294 RepID=A0A563UB57_9SPHI|nr:hypothetical protein [Mucilaginibacter achroorhodeus]TWR28608.1 hypothetical protein FPZ42_05195 [Mucilaginibacter achroorhodeus]